MRRGAFLVAVAICIAAVLAPSAQAKVRAGVHSADEVRTANEWQRMAQGDVGIVRMSLEWRDVDASPDAPYDWSRYDQIFRQTSANGLKILPVMIGSPSYANLDAAHPPRFEAHVERWKDFLTAAVNRYGRDGEFWCQSPDPIVACSADYEPIKSYQVWNEPSLEAFWGDPDAEEYAEFLKLSRKAIEDGDEDAEIVLAGIVPYTSRGINFKPYIKDLYDTPKFEKQFDVMALHPYGRDEDDVELVLDDLDNLLAKLGDGGREVWVTEFGWASDGDSKSFLVKDREQQANLLRKTLNLMNDRKAWDIDTATWFDFRDDAPPGVKKGPFNYTGLFEHNGFAKPAWFEFTDFTGGSAGSGDVDISSASSKSSGSEVLETPPDDLRPVPTE